MRTYLALPLALLFLAACGGGSSIPSSELGTATVTGEVLSVDGSTSNLGGILLALRETGETVVTTSDGAFVFASVPTGSVTIDLDALPAPSSKAEDAGTTSAESDAAGPHRDENGDGLCDEDGHQYQNGECFDDDEIEDGEDADEDDVSLHRVRAREQIHIRLRLRDGEIEEMDCAREQNEERETERHMEQTASCDDADVEFAVEVESTQERERLKIRVEQADEGRRLECWVDAPQGESQNLGTRTVEVSGTCEWLIDTSSGGQLPHGAAGVDALEGAGVRVRDYDTGTDLGTGSVPGLPPFRYGEGVGSGDTDRDRDQDGAQAGLPSGA